MHERDIILAIQQLIEHEFNYYVVNMFNKRNNITTFDGRLLAELEVAELIESLGSGQYQTLPQLFETNFLYNIWYNFSVCLFLSLGDQN